MEDLKEPHVPPVLVEHLEKVFNIDYLLNRPCGNSDIRCGYLTGVREVINFLKNKIEE